MAPWRRRPGAAAPRAVPAPPPLRQRPPWRRRAVGLGCVDDRAARAPGGRASPCCCDELGRVRPARTAASPACPAAGRPPAAPSGSSGRGRRARRPAPSPPARAAPSPAAAAPARASRSSPARVVGDGQPDDRRDRLAVAGGPRGQLHRVAGHVASSCRCAARPSARCAGGRKTSRSASGVPVVVPHRGDEHAVGAAPAASDDLGRLAAPRRHRRGRQLHLALARASRVTLPRARRCATVSSTGRARRR